MKWHWGWNSPPSGPSKLFSRLIGWFDWPWVKLHGQMPREWLEHRLEEFHHIAPEMRGNHIHQCIPRCFKSLDYLLPKSSFTVNSCGYILCQKMHKSSGKFYISFDPIPLNTQGIHAFDDCGTGKRSHLFLLCLLEVSSPRAPSWPLFLKGQPRVTNPP